MTSLRNRVGGAGRVSAPWRNVRAALAEAPAGVLGRSTWVRFGLAALALMGLSATSGPAHAISFPVGGGSATCSDAAIASIIGPGSATVTCPVSGGSLNGATLTLNYSNGVPTGSTYQLGSCTIGV